MGDYDTKHGPELPEDYRRRIGELRASGENARAARLERNAAFWRRNPLLNMLVFLGFWGAVAFGIYTLLT